MHDDNFTIFWFCFYGIFNTLIVHMIRFLINGINSPNREYNCQQINLLALHKHHKHKLINQPNTKIITILSTMQPASTQPKPQNMLLLQCTTIDSRVFPVHSLQDALEKMIAIYCEALALKNANNPDVEDVVSFSLKQMVDFFSTMENIMYMEKDMGNSSKDKHKVAMQSFDKDFVLASLRINCIKRSTDKSIEMAQQLFKNGQNQIEFFRNMGFTNY